MSIKPGLGRNFESLLPSELISETYDPTASQDEKISQLRQVEVDKIVANPNQPRQEFEAEPLRELTDSIKQHGVLQPLIVSHSENGQFVIVAGERRWRAGVAAGLKELPVLVRSLSDQHKLEISLIENLQRQNLNSLETATAYLKLRDQFNMNLEQIGRRVGGKSNAVISNTIRLLRLPAAAKEALVKHSISEGHARQILAIEDPAVQTELLKKIIRHTWSVRQAEQFVIGYKKGSGAQKKAAARVATRTETPLTKKLAHRLKTSVKVKTTAKGGQLIINFKNEAELERIVKGL